MMRAYYCFEMIVWIIVNRDFHILIEWQTTTEKI